jgi:hypothetical protein
MARLIQSIKYSPVTVGLYEKILEQRCQSVDSYIFVATTGRSGSTSLSRIFEAAENAVCFHEPYPSMQSRHPDPADKNAYFERKFRQKKKINILRAAAGHRYYLETNHLFLKNFFEPAADYFGEQLRVIHLVRDPVRVASSFFAIDSIPGKTRMGHLYLLNPAHEDNLIRINDLLDGDPSFEHDLYKCLWYWYEIEARVQHYRTAYPSLRWTHLKTEELNEKPALVQMFDEIGVRFDPQRLGQLVGNRSNLKKDRKKHSVDWSEAEAMHSRLREKIEERHGFSPPFLQLAD